MRLGISDDAFAHSKAIAAIKRDTSLGILQLPLILPWLTKFDISLDIIDCLGGKPTDLLNCSDSHTRRRHLLAGPLPTGLDAFRSFRYLDNLDIKIIWSDLLGQECLFQSNWDKATKTQQQEAYVRALRCGINAKSIQNSYC